MIMIMIKNTIFLGRIATPPLPRVWIQHVVVSTFNTSPCIPERGEKTEDTRPKTEDRRPKRRGRKKREDERREDRGQKTEDRKEKTRGERREDKGQRTEDRRQEKRSEDQEKMKLNCVIKLSSVGELI